MEEKQQIRNQYKALRDTLTTAEIGQMSAQIADNLLAMPAMQGQSAILCYSSFGSEVDTRALIRRLLQERRAVALPVTQLRTQTMYAARIQSFESLRQGGYGILEPAGDAEQIPAGKIGVVLLPGLVFGRDGYRIGYGKGYYDKYLRACPQAVRIALAYGFQVLDRIPHEPHDLPAHYIVTPEEVICCE